MQALALKYLKPYSQVFPVLLKLGRLGLAWDSRVSTEEVDDLICINCSRRNITS